MVTRCYGRRYCKSPHYTPPTNTVLKYTASSSLFLQELLDSDTLLEEEDLVKPDPSSLRSQSNSVCSYVYIVCSIYVQVNVVPTVARGEHVKTG